MNAAMTLILACVGIFGFFVLLFGFLLLFRYINYREKVKLAEKGIFPQEEPKQKPKKGLLIAGWIITILGFLGTIIFWLFGISVTGSGYGYGFPMGLGPWVLLGLFPMLLGLILLLIYVVRSPSKNGYQKKNPTVEMNLDPFHNDLASSSQNDAAPSDSDTNL